MTNSQMNEGAAAGVLGAGSMVGESLIPLLINEGRHVFAFSRKAPVANAEAGVSWMRLSVPGYISSEVTDHGISHPGLANLPSGKRLQGGGDARHRPAMCTAVHEQADNTVDSAPCDRFPSEVPAVEEWLCLAPIRVLPDYFSMLETAGVRRIVALSSTSRFTKTTSLDPAEKADAASLAEGEERLKAWAESKGVEWVILRPTLIYGLGRDRNISEIARFIRRFRFFPFFGKAGGLRQPIHVEDVAAACVSALKNPIAANRAYNISGGETLPYRDMVGRVFAALHRRRLSVMIPLAAFRVSVSCLRLLPRYRHWSAEMAERMNRDMVFTHAEAAADLGFSPRPFRLGGEDLPQ
ncbi:MAG: NAD-dependent epimerase/dehydratase family protein [Desulfurivibrionaceae bacterium]